MRRKPIAGVSRNGTLSPGSIPNVHDARGAGTIRFTMRDLDVAPCADRRERPGTLRAGRRLGR